VGKLEKYTIPFAGLKEGKHLFDFNIGPSFFTHFEKSEIQNGNLHVVVEMEKKPRLLELEFIIKGEVEVLCDRCLDPFYLPVSSNQSLFVKFGKEQKELSDELLVLEENEHKIELAHYIYEFIQLSLPYQRIHPNDASGQSECNKEMIKKLNIYTVAKEVSSRPNPVWDKLNKIKH